MRHVLEHVWITTECLMVPIIACAGYIHHFQHAEYRKPGSCRAARVWPALSTHRRRAASCEHGQQVLASRLPEGDMHRPVQPGQAARRIPRLLRCRVYRQDRGSGVQQFRDECISNHA